MKFFLSLLAATLPLAAFAQTNPPATEPPQQPVMNLLILTNAVPALLATNLPPKERAPTEIFADMGDFDLKNRSAVYRGHVRVIDPLITMTCDMLTAQVSTNRGRPESIIASGNVRVEGVDDQGRAVHVTCDKAVNLYKVTSTTTNDTITLTGNVYMESAMFSGTGDPIVWDRITDSIHGENLQMQGRPEIKKSGTNTPSLKTP